MNQRYRLFKRGWGVYYAFDNLTGKQDSLKTRDRSAAERILHARNEAYEQPLINLQIARAYLAASDPATAKRTWQEVMDQILSTVTGSTRDRWVTAIKDPALGPLKALPIVETRAAHFLKALEEGTVATNVFLRRLHNFALDMSWLLGPVIPKRQWPKVKYGEKRAITLEEHQQIVEREKNPERQAFYHLCWYLGGSQSDIALLQAENIDWMNRIITFERVKLKGKDQQPCQICFGEAVASILDPLPKKGPLFPYLRGVRASDRATEFKQRCRGLGITGVTLHSYRYSWAERAKSCGYPERFAQQALGHNSKAVHRAYARHALVRIPPLEEYEKKIVPFRNTEAVAPIRKPV